MHEKKIRSFLKGISHRVVSSLITVLIVFILTGRTEILFAAGSLDLITKLAFYFFHERLWNRTNFGLRKKSGGVIWLTGLPSSGKTTIATELINVLTRKGYNVQAFDGDQIRNAINLQGFSRNERNQHVKTIGYIASILEKNGIISVVSLVSPYRDSRDFVRKVTSNYFEIWVSTPLEECIRRDTKGLYKKALEGKIEYFTGISDPYEPPEKPELIIDTTKIPLDETIDIIVKTTKRSFK